MVQGGRLESRLLPGNGITRIPFGAYPYGLIVRGTYPFSDLGHFFLLIVTSRQTMWYQSVEPGKVIA
jgi:hypothetical protein